MAFQNRGIFKFKKNLRKNFKSTLNSMKSGFSLSHSPMKITLLSLEEEKKETKKFEDILNKRKLFQDDKIDVPYFLCACVQSHEKVRFIF